MLATRLKNQGIKVKCKYNYKNEIKFKIKHEFRPKKAAIPNRLSSAKISDEDMAEREDIMGRSVKVYRKMLPEILEKLSRIKDPRNASYIKHKMAVLFAYGILLVVFQIGSRRQANKEISRGVFLENLQDMFPEIKTLPHGDTLSRLLENLEDVSQIQECAVELIKDLIREKKFENFLTRNRYLIAIDGTQKQIRDYQFAEKALHKNYNNGEKFYVYVAEAIFVLSNGITLPLMSEILENEPEKEKATDKINVGAEISTTESTCSTKKSDEQIKQDSERKAFKRLAIRIKKAFPSLPITLVLDGLYANGPTIAICMKNKWQYMLTLKEGSMKDVWKQVNALIKFVPENRWDTMWGERSQTYTWANDVEYEYQDPETNKYKFLTLHVVLCHESWEEFHSRSTGKTEKKETQYSWISSEPLKAENVFFRCTKIARSRWKIENFILKEKHQGYHYEHFYSYNWNAMKAYHYLMHIGHLMNALALGSDLLFPIVEQYGIRGFVQLFKLAVAGAKVCSEKIKCFIETKYIFRLAS
jgi:hypothetical protein